MLPSISFLYLFEEDRVDLPLGPSSNANFPLVDIGFIFFPTPISALAKSQFVCDSWWSQAPSDE